MSTPIKAFNQSVTRVVLPDGTSARIHPIGPEFAPRLVEGLQKLSFESRYRRFFSVKREFSPEELEYLTNCDGVNHFALALTITDENDNERESVAVARCIRDKADPALAEFAITVIDAWQRRGIGTILGHSLARRAWEAGIRRISAYYLAENSAVLKLLRLAGRKQSHHFEGMGVMRAIYELSASALALPQIDKALKKAA